MGRHQRTCHQLSLKLHTGLQLFGLHTKKKCTLQGLKGTENRFGCSGWAQLTSYISNCEWKDRNNRDAYANHNITSIQFIIHFDSPWKILKVLCVGKFHGLCFVHIGVWFLSKSLSVCHSKDQLGTGRGHILEGLDLPGRGHCNGNAAYNEKGIRHSLSRYKEVQAFLLSFCLRPSGWYYCCCY